LQIAVSTEVTIPERASWVSNRVAESLDQIRSGRGLWNFYCFC